VQSTLHNRTSQLGFTQENNYETARMDPISLSAATQQFLGVVAIIIGIVAKYNAEMAKSPRELVRFAEELRQLRNVLETLESILIEGKNSPGDNLQFPDDVKDHPSSTTKPPPSYSQSQEQQRPRPTTATIRALSPLQEPLSLYLEDFRALEAKLEIPSWQTHSRRRRSAASAIGWPLKEEEAKKEMEKMKTFREHLSEAMQVDTL